MRPHEICQKLSEDLNALAETGSASASSEDGKKQIKQVSEDVQRRLHAILEAFEPRSSSNGKAQEESLEEVRSLLSLILDADLPARLIAQLDTLEFEVRKDVITVFCTLLQLSAPGAGMQMAEYLRGHPRLFPLLLEGYKKPEVALHCGMMLRSCARHQELVETFLESGEITNLIEFAHRSSFDVSSDAFSSLHELLLAHKAVAAAWLEAHFVEFFVPYNGLLQSEDYVTQRQALKLLGEVLLDRAFMRVMLKYIGDDQFLQIHMNLLRDRSKAIQLEAFHVFKIFVANPQKPPRVAQILHRNKERLVKLLETFLPNRSDDRQFLEDRRVVVDKLQALEAPLRPAAARSASDPARSSSDPAVASEQAEAEPREEAAHASV